MKIGFLTLEYPHPKTGSSGGIGTSILNLTKGLVALGHEVCIIVYGQPQDAVFQDNGITFYCIQNIKFKGLSLFLTQKKVKKLINKLVKENKIDLIEAHDWTGFTAFVNLKCPIIIKLHGSDTYFCHLEHRPVKWKNKFLENRALQKADGIISVSNFTAQVTKKLFHLKTPIIIIPNAIDTHQFETVSEIINSDTILYFGTIIRKKGLLELPLIFNEVVKKIPTAKLLLVGKDASDIATNSQSTWQLMQPLFDNEAIQNVSYLGAVSYAEIKTTIQQATLCVFPTFAEALPVSWLEAMAMQKPIVASNIGWATDIVDNGINGYLVHPNNHNQFADRILELLQDKNLQLQFGNNARKKIIEKFSIESVAAQSVAFYNQFLNKK